MQGLPADRNGWHFDVRLDAGRSAIGRTNDVALDHGTRTRVPFPICDVTLRSDVADSPTPGQLVEGVMKRLVPLDRSLLQVVEENDRSPNEVLLVHHPGRYHSHDEYGRK